MSRRHKHSTDAEEELEEYEEEHGDEHAQKPKHKHSPGFIKRLISSLIINVAALYVVVQFVDGIEFAPHVDTVRLQLRTLIVVGVLIGLANGILKPVLRFFTFPLILLTLGLTLLVINMALFWFVLDNVEGIIVTGGIGALFFGSIVFSIVNTTEHILLKAFYKVT